MKLKLAACASIAALLAVPAAAQQANSRVINGQIQFGDVFANMDVQATNVLGTATSSALAVGNSVSAANTTGGITMTSDQTNSGAIGATATFDGDYVEEAVIVVSSAQANALEAQTTNGDLDLDARQTSTGPTVTATARANFDYTPYAASAASAAVNNAVADVQNGDLTARLTQTSATSAEAIAEANFGQSEDTVLGATATGNAFSANTYTSTVSADYTQISAGANVRSTANLQQTVAGNVTAAASAAGNSANLASEYGYAAIRGRQTNSSAVRSTTTADLGEWWGTAVASAYGVGNATLATNVGSDLEVDVQQINTGGVDAEVSLAGGGLASDGNGDAIVSATAIGNAFTGYVCSYCGDAAVNGTVVQTNSGNITARGTVATSSTGSVIGTASAIGNSATFITTTNRQ